MGNQAGGASLGFKLIVMLLVVFGVLGFIGHIGQDQRDQEQVATRAILDRQKALQAQQLKDQAATEFAEQRDSILGRIRGEIDAGRLTNALHIARNYQHIDDAELSGLRDTAQEKLLVEQLKTIPAAETETNRDKYAQLVQLRPDNTHYKAKLDHYSGILKRREAAQQARLDKFGPYPERLSSGFAMPVAVYLQRAAHDPDSIEYIGCTDTMYVDAGWLVGCAYRGKNAFGGLVRNADWFVIRHGAVVAVKESDAYAW